MISKKEFNNLKNEVSVLCFSYNFKKSIEKCLDSILSQIISIPMKIYCIDDGSNDGTQEILKKYAYKNKNIKLILSSTNSKLPLSLVFKSNIDFNSKYFCAVDGDDYWLNSYNLQKKIDILFNNKKIIGCSSVTKMIDGSRINLIKPDLLLFNKSDTIIYANVARFYCHTTSLLWKNYYYNKKTKLPFPKYFSPESDGDAFLFNQMLDNHDQIYVIPEILSVYNYNRKGVWSKLSKKEQDRKNKTLKKKFFYYSSFKYKILYFLVFFLKLAKLNKYKIHRLFCKILKIEPVNIL